LKNKDLWRISPTLRNRNNLWKSSKLRLTYKLNKMLPPRLRRKPLTRRLLRKKNLLNRKLMRKKIRSNNKRKRKKPRRKLRRLKL
jgi:hypothetical protein